MLCAGFDADLYELYALGVLEEPEAGELRSHIRQDCETCRTAVQASLLRVSELAYMAPTVAPPRALRARITALVKPAPSRWERFRLPAFGLAGAALVAVAVSSVMAGRFLTEYRAAQSHVTVVSRLSPPPVPRIEAPEIGPPGNLQGSAPDRDRRLDDARKDLAASQAAAAALTHDLERQRAEVARLESDVVDRDRQLASARRDLNAAEARYAAASPDPAQAKAMRAQLASDQSRIEELTRQAESYRTSLDLQKREIDRNAQLAALLSAPGLRVVDLQATEQGAGASGRAILAGGRAVFIASQLPALSAGRSYQLWFIRSRGPAIVSAGVFQPGPGKGAALEVNNASLFAGLTAMAVTEEPAGGSPLPTGHKILVGTAAKS